MYIYIYIYIERERERYAIIYADSLTMPNLREMGGAPRSPAPRNHLLVRIVKSPSCHCADALGGKECRRVPTPLRSTSPFSDNLPTEIIPTKFAGLKLSGKFATGLGIPPLNTKMMLESNLLQSRILVITETGRRNPNSINHPVSSSAPRPDGSLHTFSYWSRRGTPIALVSIVSPWFNNSFAINNSFTLV